MMERFEFYYTDENYRYNVVIIEAQTLKRAVEVLYELPTVKRVVDVHFLGKVV